MLVVESEQVEEVQMIENLSSSEILPSGDEEVTKRDREEGDIGEAG